nr:tRNA pseudouridine(13) synthase TruD [Granulosicoccus sp.]
FNRASDSSNAGDISDSAGRLRLLRAERHQRKLRRGTHISNGFSIRLHNVQCSDITSTVDAVLQRIQSIKDQGFPNYIGAQRFGQDQRNVERVQRWIASPKTRVSRQKRSLWLSVARSIIFNEVVAARVVDNSWQHLQPGEPVMLHGSRSYFCPSEDEFDSDSLRHRLKSMDVHPSAPWWGRGDPIARGRCATFEAQIVSRLKPYSQVLERFSMDQQRRALRTSVTSLEHSWLNDQTLKLKFNLLPGVFATTLLRELGQCIEPERTNHGVSQEDAVSLTKQQKQRAWLAESE